MCKNIGGKRMDVNHFRFFFGGRVDQTQIWGVVSPFFIRYGLIVKQHSKLSWVCLYVEGVQKVCGTQKKISDQTFLEPKFFQTNNLFKTQIFLPQTFCYLGHKIVYTQNCWYQIQLSLNYLLIGPNIAFTQNFWIKNCLGPYVFCIPNFFLSKKYLKSKICMDTLAQNSFNQN